MYFVLLPDAVSSYSIRQCLADNNPVNVRVGTFSNLLSVLSELWLLPVSDGDFTKSLRDAALSVNDAFWAESICVDEVETIKQLEESLRLVLKNLPLSSGFSPIDEAAHRVDHYFNDLSRLYALMQGERPEDQMQSARWLEYSDQCSIDELRVVCLPGMFELDAWQQQVVDRLLQIFPDDDRQRELRRLLRDALSRVYCERADLQRLATSLFLKDGDQSSISNDHLHITACRDQLEEAEVLVGRLQQAVDSGVEPADIAVLMPAQSDFQPMVAELLHKAGLNYSNMTRVERYFQWDVQLLRDLVQWYGVRADEATCTDPMIMGAILVNPLMPWSLALGQRLYDEFQSSGCFDLDACKDEIKPLLSALQHPLNSSVEGFLDEIVVSLSFSGFSAVFNNTLPEHLDIVKGLFAGYGSLTIVEQCLKVIRQLQPGVFAVSNDEEERWLLNGILLVSDTDYLLKPVDHLFVVGFNQGNYEPKSAVGGVFDVMALQRLSLSSGFDFCGNLNRDVFFEKRFRRFFASAKYSVNFSFSEQSGDGSRLKVSDSLLDIAVCLHSVSDIDVNALISSTRDPEINIPYFVRKNEIEAIFISEDVQVTDLEFGMDLLALHKDRGGEQRKESPSSLQKMMVSPLAWLLDRQGLTPRTWEVQGLPVTLLGTIAHKVFELHFDKANPLSLDDYDQLFNQALEVEAVYLLDSKWRMERVQLKAEVHNSLSLFVEWCEVQGWETYLLESLLEGEFLGLPVKGYVDAVFKRGNDTLILDYKKSKAKRFVDSLNQGFDLQIMMYKKMFLHKEGSSGSMYCGYLTLNDNKIILDSSIDCDVNELEPVTLTVPIAEQSAAAEEMLRGRIADLRAGRVALNTDIEAKVWEKRGLNVLKYILEENPLVNRFLKQSEEV